MTVYGTSAARDRQGWFLGLTGPQLALVVLAAFPSWLAMAVGAWVYLLALVPAWGTVTVLVCVPIRGWSAFQWIGVLARQWAGAVFGWSTFQSRAAGGDLDMGDGAD
ncbi:MAG: SCO6880 family protein, partial [Pseudonocardiaceae bacterium]